MDGIKDNSKRFPMIALDWNNVWLSASTRNSLASLKLEAGLSIAKDTGDYKQRTCEATLN